MYTHLKICMCVSDSQSHPYRMHLGVLAFIVAGVGLLDAETTGLLKYFP